LVPILKKKNLVSKAEDIKEQSHAILQYFNLSLEAFPLSRPLPTLNNATLRTTLMAVTTKEGKKLFLLVDPTWNRQGYTVSYPTLYTVQASNFIEYLPAYLAHSHGKEVNCWFTPDVIAEAQAMGWDKDQQHPISQDGLALWNTLQSLDLEWCITATNPMAPGQMAMDLDNITLPSFNTTTKLAQTQPDTPLVAPASTQAPVQTVINLQDDLMIFDKSSFKVDSMIPPFPRNIIKQLHT